MVRWFASKVKEGAGVGARVGREVGEEDGARVGEDRPSPLKNIENS
jgi:hypothetical protein